MRADFFLALLLVPAVAMGQATPPPPPRVVGLDPTARPAWAPRILSYVPAEDWHSRALRGIATPPPSLRFLADQGPWYTPFDRPGMTGAYDWRHWHAQSGKAP